MADVPLVTLAAVELPWGKMDCDMGSEPLISVPLSILARLESEGTVIAHGLPVVGTARTAWSRGIPLFVNNPGGERKPVEPVS